MIVFYAVIAASFVVLLGILRLRRMRKPIVDFTADVELSRPRFHNYAFAVNHEVTTEDRISAPSQQNGPAEFRQDAHLSPSRLSSRQTFRSHLIKLFKGHFRHNSPENELRPRPVKLRGEPAEGFLSEARRSRPAEQFTGTLDLLPLAVLVIDSHCKIVFANAAAEKLFGYVRKELTGVVGNRLLPALQLHGRFECTPAVDLAPSSTTARDDRDLVAKRKDGTEFPAEVTTNPVSPEGEPYVLTIVTDRTERYELLRNRQQLAHLTRVSTLGELAGSLAHELNQPLTAILSNAQAAQRFLAKQPIDLAEVREILHDLVEDNNRASEVIRKIRALVKKGELEAALLSIASVIRDVVLLVHSDAIVRRIRVSVAVAPELPPVLGDKVQLQQVMLNLLLNAFDATESRPSLDSEVTIEAILVDSNSIRVGVRDAGSGLAVDTVDKLFLPFFTSKRDGLGLGLSISRSIVEMHRGRLWAENNKDRGATFYFTLPIATSARPASARREP